MPSLFNVLVCVLAVLIGVVLGRWYRMWRSRHGFDKNKKDGQIDMSRHKNLNALKEKRQARLHKREIEKARKNGSYGSITKAAGSNKSKDNSNK